jgi:hypothetical protein
VLKSDAQSSAGWVGFCVAVLIPMTVLISSCRNSAPALANSTKPQQEARALESRALSAEEQSCKAFVQGFYDWYWNQFAVDPKADHHTYDDALTLRPTVLSENLTRLIKRDDARAKAAGGIANLDFDPFLNSQDPTGKYDVVEVSVNGAVCRTKLSQRDIDVESKRNGTGWVFSNIHYSFYSDDRQKKEVPDDDLAHILGQP